MLWFCWWKWNKPKMCVDQWAPAIEFFCLFGLSWVFTAACGLSLVEASRGYSLLQCMGLSLCWLFLLQSTGLVAAGQVASAQPRIELVSPALAGGLLTTGPPRKSPYYSLLLSSPLFSIYLLSQAKLTLSYFNHNLHCWISSCTFR